MDGATLETLRSACARALSAAPEVAVVYVFGSVARGSARPDSDLDVGVVYRGAVSTSTGEQIADRLAAELGSATAREQVDVIALHQQGAIFAHRALCEGVVIYEADRVRRVDFESETMVRAFDFQPTYEIATRGKISPLRSWLRGRYDLGSNPDEARRAEG